MLIPPSEYGASEFVVNKVGFVTGAGVDAGVSIAEVELIVNASNPAWFADRVNPEAVLKWGVPAVPLSVTAILIEVTPRIKYRTMLPPALIIGAAMSPEVRKR